MTTTITTVYRAAQGGMSLSALQSAVAAVALPDDVIDVYGLRVTSDTTSISGSEVLRTIVFSMLPSSNATATADVDSNAMLRGLAVTAAGAAYVAPPIVSFPGQSLKPPKAIANLKAVAATISAAGSSYSADIRASVFGGLNPSDPNARPVKLSLTLTAGAITGVTIVDAGFGYVSMPDVAIFAATGSGGAISLSFGVAGLEILFPGEGLTGSQPVTLTPLYKSLFPDGSEQGAPVANLVTTAIANAVMTPIVADPPVVS